MQSLYDFVIQETIEGHKAATIALDLIHYCGSRRKASEQPYDEFLDDTHQFINKRLALMQEIVEPLTFEDYPYVVFMHNPDTYYKPTIRRIASKCMPVGRIIGYGSSSVVLKKSDGTVTYCNVLYSICTISEYVEMLKQVRKERKRARAKARIEKRKKDLVLSSHAQREKEWLATLPPRKQVKPVAEPKKSRSASIEYVQRAIKRGEVDYFYNEHQCPKLRQQKIDEFVAKINRKILAQLEEEARAKKAEEDWIAQAPEREARAKKRAEEEEERKRQTANAKRKLAKFRKMLTQEEITELASRGYFVNAKRGGDPIRLVEEIERVLECRKNI